MEPLFFQKVPPYFQMEPLFFQKEPPFDRIFTKIQMDKGTLWVTDACVFLCNSSVYKKEPVFGARSAITDIYEGAVETFLGVGGA